MLIRIGKKEVTVHPDNILVENIIVEEIKIVKVGWCGSRTLGYIINT